MLGKIDIEFSNTKLRSFRTVITAIKELKQGAIEAVDWKAPSDQRYHTSLRHQRHLSKKSMTRRKEGSNPVKT